MKTIRIHSFGDASVLTTEDAPRPIPNDHQILIRVCAASVNPIDYKIRSGSFNRTKIEFPATLGRDVAGTIEAMGDKVGGFDLGDDVFAFLSKNSGGYAEYALAEENEIAPKPETLDFISAAAVPLAATTAWQGLFDHGELEEGQRVLIHGAAGGVGLFAVQFAKVRGATVIATGRKDDIPLLHRVGADQTIDYQSEKFENIMEDVDLVLDLVGGETQERSWNVLRKGGRLISTVQPPSDEKARQHGATGKVFMARARADQLRTIGRLIDEGSVAVHIEKTVPLDHVAEAHESLEHQHTQGKIVLTVT